MLCACSPSAAINLGAWYGQTTQTLGKGTLEWNFKEKDMMRKQSKFSQNYFVANCKCGPKAGTWRQNWYHSGKGFWWGAC